MTVAKSTRPKCVNLGCDKPVAHDGARLRPVCSHCQKASYGAQPYAPGVTPFRTGRCRNQDGHLGFACAIDYERTPWAVGITEIDHRDGSYYNNSPENLNELCPICHKLKGRQNSDYRSGRYRKKSLTTATDLLIILTSTHIQVVLDDIQQGSTGASSVHSGSGL